jgi:NAD(P)-dependent dehydrogenase (short-subunit alcohol dehydrogenase family)
LLELYANVSRYPSEAFTRVLTLNLHRVFDLTQLVTPLLEKAATPAPVRAGVVDEDVEL